MSFQTLHKSICFDHLLPGNFSQLLIVLDDSPKEKVSAKVPLCFSIVLPERSLGTFLTFGQLGKVNYC